MAPRLRSKNTPNNRYVHDNDEGCTQMDILKEKTKKRKFKNVDETLETSNKKSKIKKINSLPKYTEELLKNNFTSIKTPENRDVLDNDEGCAQMDILKEKPKKKKLKNNDETLETSNKKSKIKKINSLPKYTEELLKNNFTSIKTPENRDVLDNDEGCAQMDILKEKPKKKKLKNNDETLETSNKKSKMKKINSLPKYTEELLKNNFTSIKTPENRYVLDNDEGCAQMDTLKEKPKKKKLKNIDETLEISNKKSKMKKINSLPKNTAEMLKKNCTCKRTPESLYVLDNDEGCAQMDILKEKPKKKKLKNNDETLETSNKKSKMKKNCTCKKTPESLYVLDNDEGCTQMDILKEKPKKNKLKNIDETLEISNKKSKVKKINSLPKNTAETLKKSCTCKRTPESLYVLDNDEGCTQMDILKEKPKKKKLKNTDETLETSNKKSKMKKINSLPKYTEEMLKKNCTSNKTQENCYVRDNDEGCTQMDILKEKPKKKKLKNIDETLGTSNKKSKMKKINSLPKYTEEMLKKNFTSKKTQENSYVLDNDEGCAQMDILKEKPKKRKLKNIDETLGTSNKKSKMKKINSLPKYTEEMLKKKCTSKKTQENSYVLDNDEGCAQMDILKEKPKKRKLKNIDETLETSNKKSKRKEINSLPKYTEEMLKKNFASIKCTVNLGGTQICMSKLSKYKRKNITNTSIYSKQKKKKVEPCDEFHDLHSSKPSMYIGPFVDILDDRPLEVQNYTRNLRIKRLLKGKSPYEDKYKYKTSLHKLNVVLQQFLPFGIEEYIPPQSVFPSDDQIIQDLTLTELIQKRLNKLRTEGKERNLFYHQESSLKQTGNKCSWKEKCINKKKRQDFIYLRNALHKRLIYRPKLTNLTYIEQKFNLRNLLKNNYSLTMCPKKVKKYYNILHKYSLKIVSEYCKIYKVNSLLTKKFLKIAKDKTIDRRKSSKKNTDCTLLQNNGNVLQNNSNDPVSNKVFEKESISRVIKYYQKKCNKKSFDENLTKYVVVLRDLVNYNLIKTKPQVINTEYLKMIKSVYIVYKYPNILQTRIRTTGNVIKGDIHFGKCSSTCISFNTSVKVDNVNSYTDDLSIIKNKRKSNQILKYAKLKEIIKSFSIHISNSDLVIVDQILENIVKNYNSLNSDTCQINEISDFIISCKSKSFKAHSKNHIKENNIVYHVDIDDNEVCVRKNEAGKFFKFYNFSRHEKNRQKSPFSINPIDFKFKQYKSNYLTNVIKSWEIVAINMKITIRKMKLIDRNTKDGQLMLKAGILSLIKNPDDKMLLYNSNIPDNCSIQLQSCAKNVNSFNEITEQIHENSKILNKNEILNHSLTSVVETQNCHDPVKDKIILEQENDFDKNADSDPLYNSNSDEVNIEFPSNDVFVEIAYETKIDYSNNYILNSDEKLNNLTSIVETQNCQNLINDKILENENDFGKNDDSRLLYSSNSGNIQLPSSDETTEQHLNNDILNGDEILNHNPTSIVTTQNCHDAVNDNNILEKEDDVDINVDIRPFCIPYSNDDNIQLPSSDKTEQHLNNDTSFGDEILNHNITLTVETQNCHDAVNDNKILENENDFGKNDIRLLYSSNSGNIQLPSSDETTEQHLNNDTSFGDEILNHNITLTVETQNCHDAVNDNTILENGNDFDINDIRPFCIPYSNDDNIQLPSSDKTEQHLNNDTSFGDEILNHNITLTVETQNCQDAVNDNKILENGDDFDINDDIRPFCIPYSNEDNIQLPSSDKTEQHLNNDTSFGDEILNHNITLTVETQNCQDAVNDNKILENGDDFDINDDIRPFCIPYSNEDNIQLPSSDKTEQNLNNDTSFGDEILNHNITLTVETQNCHDAVNDNKILENGDDFDINDDIRPFCIPYSNEDNIQLPSSDKTEQHLNNDTSFGDEILNHNITLTVETQNCHDAVNDNKILENGNDFDINDDIRPFCIPYSNEDNIQLPSSDKTEQHLNNDTSFGDEILNHNITLTVETQNCQDAVNDNKILENGDDFDINDDIRPFCIPYSNEDNIQLPSSDKTEQHLNNDTSFGDEILNHNITLTVETQNCQDAVNDNKILENGDDFDINDDIRPFCIPYSNEDNIQLPLSDKTEQNLNNDTSFGDEILNHNITLTVETQNCHDAVNDNKILENGDDFDINDDIRPFCIPYSNEDNIQLPSSDKTEQHLNNDTSFGDEILNHNITLTVETQNCQDAVNDNKILENGDDFDINDDIRPFCIPYSNEDNIQLPSSDKTTEQYNNNDILNGDEILNHNPTSIVKTQNCHDAVNDNNILENENDFGENDDSRLLYNSNPDIVDIQLASSVEFVGIPVETTEQYLNNFTSFGDEILNHNLTLIDETQNSHDPVNDNSIFEHEKEFDNNEDNISPSCISNSDKVNIQLPSNDEFVEISVETTEKHLNNDTSFGDELLNHNVTSIVEKQNFHNVFNDNKILENENDFENNHNIAALCVPNFDDDNILFPSSNVYVEIPYEKTEHYPNNKILIGGELLNHKLTLTVESQNSYNPVNDNSILEQEKDFDNNDDNISPSCISNSDKDNIQLPSSDEIIKQYHNNDILIVDEFLNHNVTSIVKTQNCHDLDNDNNILEHEINFGNNDTDSYCISNSNVDDFQFPSSDVFVEVSSETTEQHLNNDLLSGDEMLNHNFSSIVGIQNSHDAVNDNCIVVHETNSGKNDGIVSYFISNSNEGSIQFPSSDVFVEVSSETTEQHLNNDLLSGVEMLNDNSTSIVGTQNSYDPVNDNSILEHEINLGNNDDIGSLCNLNTFDDVNDNNAFKVLKTAIEVAILDGTNKINNNAINIQNDANSSVMQYNCNNIPYEIPEDIIDFEGNYSEEISEMKYLKDLIDKYNLLNNSNIQADKSKIFIYHKIFRDLKIFIDDYLTFHYNYCSFTSEVLSYYLSNTISYEDMYNIMSIVIFSDDIFSKFISLHSTLDLYELQQCGIQLPITLNDNIDNLIQILIKCFENKISHSIHDLLILYILKRLKTEIKSLTDDLKSKIVTLINKALKYVSEPDCDLKGFVEVNNDVLHLNAAIINDCFMNNNAVAHAEENVEMQVKNTDHINIDTNNVYYEIENLLDIDLIGIDILYNSIDDLEEETTDNLESILPFTFKEPANNVDSCNNPAVIDNGEGTSGTNMPMDKNKGAKSVLKVNMNVQEIPMAEKTHFLTVHLNQMLKKNAVVVQEELAKNNPDRVVSLDNMTNGFDNAGTLLP